MEVQDILKKKGTKIYTVGPDDEICKALKIMNKHNIGSVMIVKDEEVYGIITERDILRFLYYKDCRKANSDTSEISMKVSDHMTKRDNLITAKLNAKIDTVMEQMNKHKVRRIPVMENGKLFGIVGIRDILKAVLYITVKRREILEDYITSVY